MARGLSLILGLVLLISLVPLTTQAQDKFEFFGGYSYMRVDATPSFNPNSSGFNLNGWELAGQYKFADWLGAVADVDGHYGSPSGESTSIHTFLFGPQVSWPARVSPFAHILVGGAHVTTGPFTNTSFAVAIGGGIDTELIHGLYWRIIEGDYLPTRFFGNTQNNARLSTGIVIKF
jgi:hypothetical protein